jgi:predicted Zn-dependent peptidase
MIESYTCSNGVRIIHEKMPYVRSVAIGIWIEAGSGDELEQEAGIAHFIEHMLFKGTTSRSARKIAEQFDRIGGDINAFTSKEMTCYYATVLGHHAAQALDVLSDMFFNSTFEAGEIEKEKSVVLDEIAAVEDTPDDDVHEQLWAIMFPDHPIGKPVLGNEETITSFDKKMIHEFMERMYRPEKIVISIAGNYDEDLIKLIEKQFGSHKSKPNERKETLIHIPQFHDGVLKKVKDIEQTHLCIGYSSPSVNDHRIHDLTILDSIIGGTMSSRLFQEVREERGLAYSIYSYYSAYASSGAFIIYGGTAPENTMELYETIDSVINSVLKEGITEHELLNAKEQLKGGFLLGLESSESRMHRNAKNEMLLKKHKTIDDVVSLIDSVNSERVYNLALDIFTKERAVSIISTEDVLDRIDFR